MSPDNILLFIDMYDSDVAACASAASLNTLSTNKLNIAVASKITTVTNKNINSFLFIIYEPNS
jgi:hypothetical protein